jgi:hypothetical protein
MLVGSQDLDVHSSKYTCRFMQYSHHKIHGIALGPILLSHLRLSPVWCVQNPSSPPQRFSREGPTGTRLLQELGLLNKIGV